MISTTIQLTATLSLLLLFPVTRVTFADEEISINEGATLATLQVTRIAVQPASIELTHRFDYRQLLITGSLADGQTVDLTRQATINSTHQNIRITKNRRIEPLGDGNETIEISFGELNAKIPVSVSGQGEEFETSFIRHVQPVLSKLGCNAGTCHGSKDGKNGFKLSLRGYDAVYDWRALADEIGARRFNRVEPDQSLMLLKASGEVPHVGGQLTKAGEPHYELLREWIRSGVKNDQSQSSRVIAIEVSPRNPMIPRANLKQQISVTATYSDGEKRDVTREAFIESGNIEVATANDDGTLNLIRRGEAPVLVRYEGAYTATTLTVMGDRSQFKWTNPPTNNYVDELVYQKLERIKVLPSELCSDDEFLRRVYIDLTGLPPSREQVIKFLNDSRDSRVKRNEMIDQLVGNPEYVEYWTNKWADLLQVNRKFLGEQSATALRDWIKNALATNQPYDDFANDILTASGSNLRNPPASYFKAIQDPADLMENTTHLFLAVRFNCNKCHDHPFERWTQDQYYEMAAFFAQIGRKTDPEFLNQRIGGSAVEGAKPLVEVIFDKTSGEIKHERTQQIATPAFPYQHKGHVDQNSSRRDQLAQWVTSPHNQYFARSYVNRLWGYLFGVGIIEPIDDIRAGNPPVNPELLDALEKDFIESGFDIQHIMKTICKSRVYQHSIRTNIFNADDQTNFSHALPRRLPAETLFDAIHVALDAPINIPGAAPGVRATELPDAGIKIPFLDDFGKPVRESACECERSNNVAVGPVMKLVNGPTISSALTHPDNVIKSMLATNHSDDELIKDMFLRFLARYPTQREISEIKSSLASIGVDHQQHVDRLAAYEKLLPKKVEDFVAANQNSQVSWVISKLDRFQGPKGTALSSRRDQAFVVTGPNTRGNYQFFAETKLKKISAFRLEALPDDSLGAKGPGRNQNGNFVLSEFQVELIRPGQKAVSIKLAGASASFSQANYDAGGAIDGQPNTGWAIHPKPGIAHTAFFLVDGDPVELRPGDQLRFKMIHNYTDGLHNLGCFRIALTDSNEKPRFNNFPDDLIAAITAAPDQRSEAQYLRLLNFIKTSDRDYQKLLRAFKQSENEVKNKRLVGFQDLAWALINNPAFLFNR